MESPKTAEQSDVASTNNARQTREKRLTLDDLERMQEFSQMDLLRALENQRKEKKPVDPDQVSQLLYRAGLDIKGTRYALAHVIRCVRSGVNKVDEAICRLHDQVGRWAEWTEEEIQWSRERLGMESSSASSYPHSSRMIREMN